MGTGRPSYNCSYFTLRASGPTGTLLLVMPLKAWRLSLN